MKSIGQELEAIANDDIPLTKDITAVTEYQFKQSLHFEKVLRYMYLKGEDRKITEEIRLFNEISKKGAALIKESKALANKAIGKGHTKDGIGKFTLVKQQLIAIEKEHQKYEQQVNHIFSLVQTGAINNVETLIAAVEVKQENLIEELEKLLNEIADFTDKSALLAAEHEHQAENVLTIIGVISLLLGLLTSFIVSNNIVLGIKSATQIAGGDLSESITVESNDETGELLIAMNNMREKLLNMVNEISSTTDQLSAAAEDISVITQQTTQEIQQQQAETEQVATAMNEMNATVKEVAENVANTAHSANLANTETEKGQRVVLDALEGIKELASKVEHATNVIVQVEKDSENINTVLDVIKGIADQTNLLALNSAIEAARAGEQGRGFAVVADEVRTLAGRTQESTSEINDIIEKLLAGSRSASHDMKDSQEQSQVVVEKSNLVSESLATITSAVSQIDEMSTQIATSAEEQMSVSEEMNRNIIHISDMATNNAEGISQTSDASQELAAMASKLQSVVAQFKI